MGLLPAGFRFSQASLATGEGCPRRFYLKYLRRLNWPGAADPAGLALERGADRGRLFHHLAVQHHLGLPVEAQVQASGDPVLSRWWDHFLCHPPQGVPKGEVYLELELWVPLGAWWLRARFDKVVVGPEEVCIVDWKTGSGNRDFLESWQTLVYCFAACEGGAALSQGRTLLPEQVSLCYWHAEKPQAPLWRRHGEEAHQQARSRIESLVGQLSGLENPDAFAMTEDPQRCAACEFRAYCGRGSGVGPGWEEEGEEEGGDLPLELGY